MMKNKINNITSMGMLLGLTAITALCLAPPVRAAHQGSAVGKYILHNFLRPALDDDAPCDDE